MEERSLTSEFDELSEEDVYSEEARELLVEDDALSPEEQAFMTGWDEAGDY